MKLIHLIPVGTKLNFMRFRQMAAVLSLALCIGSLGLYFFKGLNYGIDFEGGILLEIRTPQAADMDALRAHYTEEQVLEIVAVIALFGFLNRWNDTLKTDIEAAPRAALESEHAA